MPKSLSSMPLTEQQQAIVAHDGGPALVFAVAGAGKTTALVHRIARLVEEGIFPAEQILATSFNRDANQKIRAALNRWPSCADVQVCTLHALGRFIIRLAHQRQRLPYLQENVFRRPVDGARLQILYAALAEARRRKVPYAAELTALDQEDFLNYVGACKGNLAYPDLRRLDLPRQARRVARQAPAPSGLPWYRDLYALYEEMRLAQGVLTFDDLLATGWEVLVRWPDILEELQRRFQCVLVDEFQDLNLAQAEMLDLLTAPHRNYMAIGDDDQTIYEWRGASPQHFREFQRRYRATVYFMTENFRSRAVHVALANQIILHNRQRQPKQMQLTQGFGGQITLLGHADEAAMAQAVVHQIQAAQEQGYPLEEMAILVRIYAQTPALEQALIAAQIPYVIWGNPPFYRRPEVETLLNYGRLARYDARRRAGHGLTREELEEMERLWFHVYNRPLRYLSQAMGQAVMKLARTQALGLVEAIQAVAAGAAPRVAQPLTELAGLLAELREALSLPKAQQPPAAALLQRLEARLSYMNYLRHHSGHAGSGGDRAANVAALLAYARGQGSLEQFLQHLDRLAQLSTRRDRAGRGHGSSQGLTITTIFRAKGLEWPVVFVPHCNQGIIPLNQAPNLEEERRLLYVAVTRARRHLYLHWLEGQPISQFLLEAQAPAVVEVVEVLQRALKQPPETWSLDDYLALAVNAPQLHLSSYFQRWWRADAGTKQRIAAAVLGFLAAVQERGLLDALPIKPEQVALWRELAGPAAAVKPLALPGLDAWLATLRPPAPRRRRWPWQRRA
ncbi:MAG: DNA helicase [Litorilinea sp.]|nr:MAG: DNA helicase [Litorilinea sp.]